MTKQDCKYYLPVFPGGNCAKEIEDNTSCTDCEHKEEKSPYEGYKPSNLRYRVNNWQYQEAYARHKEELINSMKKGK